MSFWSNLNPMHDASVAWHAINKGLHTSEKAVDEGAKDFENALVDAGKDVVKVVKYVAVPTWTHGVGHRRDGASVKGDPNVVAAISCTIVR